MYQYFLLVSLRITSINPLCFSIIQNCCKKIKQNIIAQLYNIIMQDVLTP